MGAAVKPIKAGGKPFAGTPRKRKTSSPLDKAKGYEVIWSQVVGVFEAMRRFDGAVFVYVIGEPDDGMLKIGVSKDPISRLRTMQTGNPRRLRIEYVLAGSMQLEKRQIDYLAQHTGDVHAEDVERLIREAHADSGRVIHQRDEVRLHGQVGTVLLHRPSRI